MNLNQKLKSFYERKFGKKSESSGLAKLRIKKILSFVGSGKRVLDVGCYDGTITLQIQKQGNEVIGIDIAQKAVELARKKGIKAYVCNLEEEKIPRILGKFDVVVAAEIIEHIFDTDNFLEKLHAVIKPNGYLVLTTPNLAGLGSRLALLFGKTPWMIENSIYGEVSGHIRYFTLETLTNLLVRNKFKVTNVTSDSVGLGKTLTIPFIENLFSQFGRILIVKAQKL